MLTSKELYNALSPHKTETLTAQLLNNRMLSVNMSGVYSQLIREAARCNSYPSDVIYDINRIEEGLKNFIPNEEWEPIFIGFRRHGVDGNEFVLARIKDLKDRYSVIYKEYFVLYSVNIEKEEDDWYKVIFNEYDT